MGLHLKDTIEGTCKKAINDKDGNGIPETYLKKTGDAKDNTVTFQTDDNVETTMQSDPANPGGTLVGYKTETGDNKWHIMHPLDIKDRLSATFNKFTTLFHNVRYLYELCGKNDISKLGDGTLTGAVSKLNTDLSYKDIKNEITILKEGTTFDSAYVKNGIAWITGRAPAGFAGVIDIAKISAPYAPRTDMRGIPSYNASYEDIGKMSSICMRASGKMDIFFKTPLDYAEIFVIIYPLK